MVRTKADVVSNKAIGGKAPRKNFAGTSTSSSDGGKGRDYSGGNSYCPREIPGWQKPITSFFAKPPGVSNESATAERSANFEQDPGAGSSSAPDKDMTV